LTEHDDNAFCVGFQAHTVSGSGFVWVNKLDAMSSGWPLAPLVGNFAGGSWDLHFALCWHQMLFHCFCSTTVVLVGVHHALLLCWLMSTMHCCCVD
jgi:hypothetical protein